MRIRFIAAAAFVFAVLASISCGGITDPSKNTTETFTGTVPPGGRGTVHIADGTYVFAKELGSCVTDIPCRFVYRRC